MSSLDRDPTAEHKKEAKNDNSWNHARHQKLVGKKKKSYKTTKRGCQTTSGMGPVAKKNKSAEGKALAEGWGGLRYKTGGESKKENGG